MAEIRNYSNNPDPQTADRWPEGMAMSSVNDTGRVDEGIISRWEKDVNGSLVSTGTSSAYTLTPNRDIVTGQATPLYDGLVLAFKPHVSNAASATLNVQSTGALPLVDSGNNAISSGTFVVDVPFQVVYSTTYNGWIVSGFGDSVTPNDRTTTRALSTQATLSQGVFDVTDPDYGAVADFSTDDQAAIIAAIAASNEGSEARLHSSSVSGYILSGDIAYSGNREYTCNRALVIKIPDLNNPTALFLPSQYNAADQPSFQSETQAEKTRLAYRRMYIDGNRANNTSGHAIMAISTLGTFVDLYLEQLAGDGIHLTHKSALGDTQDAGFNLLFNMINRVRIQEGDGWGIFAGDDFNGKLTDGHMHDFTIFDTKDGVQIGSAQGWLVSNGRISQVDNGILVGHNNRGIFSNIQIDLFGTGKDTGASFFAGIDMGAPVTDRATMLGSNFAIKSDAVAGAGKTYFAVQFQGGSAGTNKAMGLQNVIADISGTANSTGLKQISDTDNDVSGVVAGMTFLGDQANGGISTPIDIISPNLLVKDVKNGSRLQTERANDYGNTNRSYRSSTQNQQERFDTFRYKKDAVPTGSAQNIARIEFGTHSAYDIKVRVAVQNPTADSPGYCMRSSEIVFTLARHSTASSAGTLGPVQVLYDSGSNSFNNTVRDFTALTITPVISTAIGAAPGHCDIQVNVTAAGSSAPATCEVTYTIDLIGCPYEAGASGPTQIVPL